MSTVADTSTPAAAPGAERRGRSRLGNDLYTGVRSYPFVQKRRTWFLVAGLLVALSLLVLVVRGINPGIEFRGGSEFTVSGASTTAEAPALDVLADVDSAQVPRVSQVGADAVRVQTEELSDEQTTQVRAGLAEAYGVDEKAVTATYIGPTWGADVSQKALTSLVVFLGLVAIVLAAYFRTWKFAVGGIVALLHDLVVTGGIYALTGFEVTPATVIGFLTILGYSLYDTVVVFDKVRENTDGILDQEQRTYEEAANLAVNQTLVRSVHTSVTGLLPVATILVVGVLLLGAGSLRDIALALFVGMLFSMVSSVFIATPVAVAMAMREERYREHAERVLARRGQRRRAALGEDATGPHEGKIDLTARAEDLHPESGHHRGNRAQPRRLPKGKRR